MSRPGRRHGTIFSVSCDLPTRCPAASQGRTSGRPPDGMRASAAASAVRLYSRSTRFSIVFAGTRCNARSSTGRSAALSLADVPMASSTESTESTSLSLLSLIFVAIRLPGRIARSAAKANKAVDAFSAEMGLKILEVLLYELLEWWLQRWSSGREALFIKKRYSDTESLSCSSRPSGSCIGCSRPSGR